MERVLTHFEQEEVDISMLTINFVGLRSFYSQFGYSTVFTEYTKYNTYSILALSMTPCCSLQTMVSNRVVMSVVPFLELFHAAGKQVVLTLPLYSPLFAYALYQHISS